MLLPNNDLVKTLRQRDGTSDEDITSMVEEAYALIEDDGDDPDDVLQEVFGLEPDYIFDLFELIESII